MAAILGERDRRGGLSARAAYNGRVTPPLPDLVLYGRPGCHLCDDAHQLLLTLLAERAAAGMIVPPLVERDIESDADWLRRYLVTIPVAAYGDRELELATSPSKLRRFLAEVLDGA
jgi:hypothetical protein